MPLILQGLIIFKTFFIIKDNIKMINPNLFDHEVGLNSNPLESQLPQRCRRAKYRTGDLVLNKMDILDQIDFVQWQFPMPLVQRVDSITPPDLALPFSKVINRPDKSVAVVFYEPDMNFARVRHNPKRYVEPLRKFPCVAGLDFSQKIGMNAFVNFSNSWWNKALTAYFQAQGVKMIPNVTWSVPSSYEYSFCGLPKNSVIAINCTAIKGNTAAMYLWQKGYKEALKALNPSLILRYGDRMPNEDEAISIYYDNINLKNLRNGSKRIAR